MTIPQSADVVVIGGGPAGSLASTVLALKGHDVVMLEKQRHPRPQVGESLIPDFWKYADLMEVTDKLLAEGFLSKAGAVIGWEGQVRAHSFGDFGYTKPAMHVERERFDQILFEHAAEKGVTTVEEATVTGVDFTAAEESGEGAVVAVKAEDGTPHSISCRYVLDASGQAAVLGRQLGLRHIDDAFRYLSIWGYWTGSRFLDLDGTAHSRDELGSTRPVTFVTSLNEAGDAGWSWHITLREETSIGLVLPIDLVRTAREPNESWESYYERRCREVPILQDLLADATLRPGSVSSIRDYSHQSSAVAGPGWFLAGDAAGFVDPIFSVGVVLAMYGAATAAWAIDRALTKPEQAERVRDMFTRQLNGRIEVARSLALPRYSGAGGEVTDLAKKTLELERSAVKDIMYAVSEFTTRSDNWVEIVGTEAPDLTDEQRRIIDDIVV
ncbi:MAG: NAD(P)/FAD-dependent oxidoreductase [Acidimicrobiia bacterium]|nr:NAD(P)/FAD-dependent oxidoreductase [Acidimicrobiia bacterium]